MNYDPTLNDLGAISKEEALKFGVRFLSALEAERQRVAEACADWVRTGLHDDDPYIIARGLEDGAWKTSQNKGKQ